MIHESTAITPSSRATLHLVDVGLTWAFVDRREERGDLRLLGQPRGYAAKFLAKTIDRLRVHVGLRNELRHRDCNGSVNINT